MKELGDVIGFAESTISQYETGKRSPDFETLLKLGEYFGVSVEYLLTGEQSPDVLQIPVYGKIPAGIPMEAIEGVLDIEEAPADWSRGGKEYFALQISGNSMSPVFIDGDVVIFLKQETCDSGQDCCVMVNGSDATFKRVYRDKKGIKLQPLNPDYEVMVYSNEEIEELPVKILGVVHELRRKFR